MTQARMPDDQPNTQRSGSARGGSTVAHGTIALAATTDYVLLTALGALWGSSFMLIKLALPGFPPLTLTVGRVAIGALVLIIIMVLRGHAFPRDPRTWLLFAAMGVIGSMIPFNLINWGEVYIDSALTAILMSAIPLATIILAPLFVRDEPVTAGKLIGVAFGMAGVAVLIGPGVLLGAHAELIGQIAVLTATLCYALNGLMARKLPKMPVEVLTAGALLCATVAGLPFSLAIDQPWQLSPSTSSLAALICLGVANTAGGYLLLFALTIRAGAGFASFNNYLSPLFGVMWGVLLLAERPSPSALLGLVLIFAGLVAVRMWPGRLKS